MVLIQNSQVFELSGINKANANTNGIAFYLELSEFEITWLKQQILCSIFMKLCTKTDILVQ
jgi:hypothetical protein